AGAPHGLLPRRGAPEGDPRRPVHVGGPRGAGVPGRRFPARPRGRAPEHLRRLGAGDQNQRGRVPPVLHLRALPAPQGADRRGVDKEFADGFGNVHRVTTFADLDKLFRAVFDGLELAGRSDTWRTHHIATIRKVRNRLANISTRCKGLVTDDGPSNDLPWG